MEYKAVFRAWLWFVMGAVLFVVTDGETATEASQADSTTTFSQDGKYRHARIWYGVLSVIEGRNSDIAKSIEELDFEADSVTIDSILSAWLARKDLDTRPDTPHENEWLLEFAKRLEFCCDRLRQRVDHYDFRDLTIRAVLLNGVPAEFELDTDSLKEMCFMVFRTGSRFGFVRDLGGGKPWKVIPHREYTSTGSSKSREIALRRHEQNREPGLKTTDERIFLSPKIDRVISPTFALASFPNNDGTFSVLTASAVHADKLTADSENQINLVRRSIIYNSAPHLEMLDSAILTFVASDNPKNTMYPFCWSHTLNAGAYNYTLAVYDDNKGLGILTHEFALPSNLASHGISDILLTQGFAEQQYGETENRVVRNGWAVNANSYPVYYLGDTLFFYAEANFSEADFKTDGSEKYQFRTYCNLLPADDSRRHAITRTEEPYMLRDSIETQYVERLIRGRHKVPAEENLIYSVSRVSRNGNQTIHDSAVIPKIPKGEYYLVLRVDDALSPASLITLTKVFIK